MDPRRQRLYRIEGVVLRRSDWGEADRLVTVYSAEQGKLRLLAKGVRKTLSRKAGHLEMFVRGSYLVAKGRTWDIITQAATIEPYLNVRQDLLRTTYAWYVSELVDRFTTEGDENRPLYDQLCLALKRLDEGESPYWVCRHFELRLLALSGYQPQLHLCVQCGDELKPVVNYFNAEHGGVLCPRCGEGTPVAEPISVNALKVLRFAQTREFGAVARLRLRPAVSQEVESLLYRYIVFILERNLKSADFLRSLRRQITEAA
ncbi:MAG: DNA repair protein RecO [Anaerolineae bacterium]